MKWLVIVPTKSKQDVSPNRVKYPWDAETLQDSTDNIYPSRPQQEETFPENIYDFETSNPAERNPDDMEFNEPTKYLGRRWLDYDTTSVVECSAKWLHLRV